MRKRKDTSKFGSSKKDPLLKNNTGLEFDTVTSDEVVELTPEQQATAFLSRYMDKEDPIISFSQYFEVSVKGEAWEFKNLKNFYIKLVVSGKWDEDKFIEVVNSIYRDNNTLCAPILDVRGRMFDDKKLYSGEKSRGSSRRRGRI